MLPGSSPEKRIEREINKVRNNKDMYTDKEVLSFVLIVFGVFCSLSIILLALSGCSHQRQVDTSQKILIEAALVLSDVDGAVSREIGNASDIAIVSVTARIEAGECGASEDIGNCAIRLLRDEMGAWYELVATLEAMHVAMEVWESANNEWRRDGVAPNDFGNAVCNPIDETISGVMRVLSTVDIVIPDQWIVLLRKVRDFCMVVSSIP